MEIDEETDNGGAMIHLLASETATEIFKLAIYVDIADIQEDRVHRRLVTPLTLGAVCKSWRGFVWGTPSLWTIITLQLTEERCKDQCDILELWLHNSNSYPLDIWFYVNFPDISASDYDQNGMSHLDSIGIITLQKLVDHSQRWKKFVMRIFDDSAIKVLRQVKGRIPLLEMGHILLSILGMKLDMFEDAPLLKSIVLNEWDIDHVVLPWDQLTSFHGDFISERGCIAILSRCTNLAECAFSFACFDPDLQSSSKPISLPHLRSLKITDTNSETIRRILQQSRLSCPELCRLHLSKDQYTSTQLPFPQIEDFIIRSYCALETLTLENVAELSPIIPILERLPSLQFITLRCVQCDHTVDRPTEKFYIPQCKHSDTDTFFNTLLMKLDLTTIDVLWDPFLPKLTELHCKIPLPLPASPSLPTSLNLLNVVQQRWCPPEGVSKLRKLFLEDTLMLDEIDDADVIDGLIELEWEGLRISIPGL